MSKLNKDILFLLFEELENDPKSLFSCLLVNRFWLETVIPILWRNPWSYTSHLNKDSLYRVITCFLPDDVKELLISQKLLSISHQSPLFDYLSFCRSINAKVIDNMISIGSNSTAFNQFILQQEIYSLFMRKCPEIKYLDMRSLKHQIFYFPNATDHLQSLCELTCDTCIDPSYFYGIARICYYIQRLIIINKSTSPNYGIVKLIEVQKNLKYFEWDDDYDSCAAVQAIYKESFLELRKKADTLIHFIAKIYYDSYDYCRFNDRTFPPEILSEFHNLKSLRFNLPPFSGGEYEFQLENTSYYKLEILQLDSIYINTLICIIKNGGGQLRKILIDDYCDIDEDNFYDETLILIRTIYENCPLIEYLTLAFPSTIEHFIEFNKLLKTCQKLKKLLLNIDAYTREPNLRKHNQLASGEKLLRALIKSAPNQLCEIRFNFHSAGLKLSLETLRSFLENWRGRTALSFITPDFDYNKREYVEIITKYKNEGVIKDFKCGAAGNIFFSYDI